jgi:hypothetical protein
LAFLLGGWGIFLEAIDGCETVIRLGVLEGEEFRDMGGEMAAEITFMLGEGAPNFV